MVPRLNKFRSIISSSKITQVWYGHTFSQSNKATKRIGMRRVGKNSKTRGK